MADITIKRGDTSPSVSATLTGAGGTAQNLTGATVRFKMRNRLGAVVINAVCAIVSAAAGTVRYDWQPADTAVAGYYEAEFEVTLAGGAIGTFPNAGFHTVEIVPDV